MNVLIGSALSEEELEGLRAALPLMTISVAEAREAALTGIPDAEAYVAGHWGDDLLQAGRALRWVHFMWAGVEGVLTPALVASDVTVTNSAGVFAVPMAEHALALMLTFARGLHLCARRSPGELWQAEGGRHSVACTVTELNGATLGVVGYGGVGRAAAERARALGMRVIAVRSRPGPPDDCAEAVYGPDGLLDALAQCDYVLISCALTPTTRGLVGADALAHMRPNAVLVNVARGAIVDEQALLTALREKRIRGAGLDVTAQEPLPLDSPLWQMENVLITPHVSGASPHTRERQMALVRENLRRHAAGEPLLNVVDKRAGH